MIVTDAFIASSGLLEPILQALATGGFTPLVFTGCVPDPTTDSVEEGLTVWRAVSAGCPGRAPDVIVGIGGGSSIDSAKAIAMLAVAGGQMSDYKVCIPPASTRCPNQHCAHRRAPHM